MPNKLLCLDECNNGCCLDDVKQDRMARLGLMEENEEREEENRNSR